MIGYARAACAMRMVVGAAVVLLAVAAGSGLQVAAAGPIQERVEQFPIVQDAVQAADASLATANVATESADGGAGVDTADHTTSVELASFDATNGPTEILTPSHSSDAIRFVVPGGVVRIDPTQTSLTDISASGNDIVAQSGNDSRMYSLGADHIEEFVFVSVSGDARVVRSWTIHLPDGYTTAESSDSIDVIDADGWIVLSISAPLGQDEHGETFQPDLSLEEGGHSFSVSFDPAVEGVSGEVALDPLYTTAGAGELGAYQAKWCFGDAPNCAFTASGAQPGWSLTGGFSQFNAFADRAHGVAVTTKPGITVGIGGTATSRYTPPAGVVGRSMVFTGDVNSALLATMGCSLTTSTGKRSAIVAGNRSVNLSVDAGTAGPRFAWMGLTATNVGIVSLTVGSQLYGCSQASGDATTMVLVDTVDPTVSAGSRQGSTAWFKADDTLDLQVTAADTGSGIASIRVLDTTGRVLATETVCDSQVATPCRTSSAIYDVSVTLSDAVANAGANAVRLQAVDFGGRVSSIVACAACSFNYDTTAPVSPNVVRDGAGTSDADVVVDVEHLVASWNAATDMGSGVASYEWCFVKASSASTCASAVVQGSTTGTSISTPHSAMPGSTYVACVRAVDVVGLRSSYRCSDGALVDANPKLVVPANMVAEATGPSGAMVAFTATAVDVFGEPVPVTCTETSGDTFSIGSHVVACTAQDVRGNHASASFHVAVVDTTAPAVSGPSAMQVEASNSAGAPVSYAAVAFDTVDGSVATVCTPASGATFPVGATTVSCHADDVHGNRGSYQFQVNVRDTTAPDVSLVGEPDVFVSGASGDEVTYQVRATDLVDGVVPVSCSPASGSVLAPGAHAVHCTATDGHGNVGTLDFVLDVQLVTPTVLAERRIERLLPHVFDEGYETNLPMGTVHAMPSATRIVLDTAGANGDVERVLAEGNFGYVDASGAVRVIDTSLEAVPGGYAPRAVAYDVTLPQHYADGVRWGLGPGHGDVVATPVNVNANAPVGTVVQGGDHLLYPLAWPVTDVVATTTGQGISEHLIARSGDAQRTYSWQLSKPEGAAYRLDVNGFLVIDLVDGTTQLLSRNPRARDARGQQIPASFSLTDNGSSTLLSLTWNTLPEAMGGTLHAPVVWPVDIDPDFIHYGPQPGVTPYSTGGGASAACTPGSMFLQFAGPASFPAGSRASCTYAAPDENYEMISLSASYFAWSLKPDVNEVSFLDTDGYAPSDSAGNYLHAFTSNDDDVPTTGSADLHWDAPAGGVEFSLDVSAGETDELGVGASRHAELQNVVRVYGGYDVTAPVISAIEPAIDGQQYLPGSPVALSVTGSDSQTACTNGSIIVAKVAEDGSETPIVNVPFGGCSYGFGYAFYELGEYSVTYTIYDAAENYVEDVRSFEIFDPIDPVITAVAPATDGQLLSAGPINLAVSGFDQHTPCTRGTIAVAKVADDGSETPIVTPAFPGCNYSFAPALVAPGEYAVTYTIYDAADNVAEETRSLMIADPIASLANGDVLEGSTDIDLEIGQNLTYGTVQLMATGPYGYSFPIGSAFAAGGYRTVTVDTREMQNGAYTIELVLVNNDGIRTLETTAVTVENARAITGTGGSLSTSAVGAGFSVVHTSGNLVGSMTDSQQSGWAAMTMSLGRVYNQQPILFADTSFGPGWRSSWDRQLIEGIDRVVTYVDATGHTWTFVPNGSATWIPAAGQRGVLRTSTDSATAAQQPREIAYPDGRVERFDASGRLAREVWPMGQSLTYTRSSSERSVDDGHGHRILATLDGSGRITSAKDAIDRTWNYGYDAAGRLSKVTDPNQSEWQFRYEADGQLKEIEDPRHLTTGVRFDMSDEFPRADLLTYPSGTGEQPETVTRAFDYAAADADVVETFGTHVTKFSLDGNGRTAVRTDPRGNDREPTYNVLGQVTSTVNEGGERTEWRYDSVGNLTDQIVAADDPTTAAVEPDRVTHYEDFDQYGNARRVEDPLHQVTTYTFDQYGNERTRTTPSGQTWETFYADGTPQPSSTKDPLQQVRTFDYHSTGQVASERYMDKDNVTQYVVRNTYDDAGQRETTRDGDRPAQAFTYDGVGRPKKSVDENGNYTEAFYDPAGNTVAQRDKEGHVTSHTYDRQGYRRTTTTPPGDATGALPRTTTFQVDQYGRVVKTTDPLGHFTEATYDEGGNKLTETDASGAVTEYEPDPMGRTLTKTEQGSIGTIDAVTGEPDSAPVVTEYEYDATGSIRYETVDGVTTSETAYRPDGSTHVTIDAEGVQLTHGYDANGNPTTETDLDGDFTDSKYDVADQQVAMIDEVGQRTDSRLDEEGRLVEEIAPGTTDRFTAQVGPNDARTLYEYGLADEVTRETDPLNQVWKSGFDPAGQLEREEDPEGGVVSYTYDANGAIETETNELDGVTKVERYPNGEVRWIEAPDGTRTEYEYDAAGNLRLERDEEGDETIYTYDASNRVVEEQAPDDTITVYEYDKRSNLVAETSDAVRNPAGDLVGGTRTTYVYDTRGNVREITGAGLTTRFTFDRAHRLKTRVEPDGRVTSYVYYPTGELKQEIDPTKGTTTYTYDKAGRVKTMVDPDGTSTVTYDPAGRVKSIAQPNVSTNYTYDKAGNPISGGIFGDARTMTYDGAGRIKSFTAGGFASTVDLRYTYDKAGNRKTMGTPNNFTTSYDYTTSGQPKSQTNQAGTESYLYDPRGRLQFYTDGSGATTKLRYDDRGMQMSEIAQTGGSFSSFTAHQEGLVSGSTDYAGLSERRAFYSHDRSSRVLRTEFSDNPAQQVVVGREYSYASGRLARIDLRAQATGTAVSGEYMEQVRSCIKPVGCFDPAVAAAMVRFEQPGIDVSGLQLSEPELQVVEAIELAANLGSPFVLREFHYDAATGRLAWIQDHTTGKRVDYTYDSQGRQLTRKRTGEQTNLSDSSTSFDSEGHLYYSVERPSSVQNMRYDAEDRLVSTIWSGGNAPTSPRVETQYRYDADGELFRYVSNSRETGQWDAQVFHNAWGLASMRVTKVDPSFTNVTSANYYFHFNHRGDVVSITDGTGAIAARYIYNAWGEFTATGDPLLIANNPFTYQGRMDTIWDTHHKRYLMGERWYDPYQARFLTPDAESAQPGKIDGPYTYAANSPVNFVDEDGRASKKAKPAPKPKKKPKAVKPPKKPKPPKAKPAPKPKAKPAPRPATQKAIRAGRVGRGSCRTSTDLTTDGQSAKAAHKINCSNSVQREVRQVLTYNFCVRGRGATEFNRNQCVPGGDVVDVTFTYFNGKPPAGVKYYRYDYNEDGGDHPYEINPTASFSQDEYNTLFTTYCLTYVPLVHSTLQWRQDTGGVWSRWVTSFKPGKPKKATPLGWGKALKCPGF